MSRSVLRVILTALILMVLVAGSTAAAIAFAEKEFKDQALDHNAELAHASSLSVARALNNNVLSVQRFAVRPSLLRAAVTKQYRAMQGDLALLVRSNTSFTSAAYYSSDARLRARSPQASRLIGFRFSRQDYFRGARTKDSFISRMYKQTAAPRVLVVSFSVAIRDTRGKLFGVLVATAPVTRLGAAFAVSAPSRGTVQVFNPQGQRVTPASTAASRSFKDNDVVGRALSGESGSREGVVTGKGMQLIAFAPAGPGWAVVVERPRAVTLAHMSTLRSRLIALGTALAILCFIAVIATHNPAAALTRKPMHA